MSDLSKLWEIFVHWFLSFFDWPMLILVNSDSSFNHCIMIYIHFPILLFWSGISYLCWQKRQLHTTLDCSILHYQFTLFGSPKQQSPCIFSLSLIIISLIMKWLTSLKLTLCYSFDLEECCNGEFGNGAQTRKRLDFEMLRVMRCEYVGHSVSGMCKMLFQKL